MSSNITINFQSFGNSAIAISHALQTQDSETTEVSIENPYYGDAIRIRNISKKYLDQTYVLQNFSMKVQRGSIYSLIGSSGCGKTTTIRCVIGREAWDAGTISVLGSPPSTKRCSYVESGKIGYMPQELALQAYLTTKEVILLYGRLYGMDTADILSRFKTLKLLLHLSNYTERLAYLSGGQQKRVSLAIALLHKPELIILDEPTVGLDPLLRQSIWEHLRHLVDNLGVTILMTTHYVDEARRSNVIGLMRNGHLIAEKSPQELSTEYECPSLDQIVLQICKRDEGTKSSVHSVLPDRWSTSYRERILDSSSSKGKHMVSVSSPRTNVSPKIDAPRIIALRRIGALLMAAYLSFIRNPGFLPGAIILPPATAALAEIIFDSDLHDLKFGYVINDDPLGNLTGNFKDANCFDSIFSQLYLKNIPSDALIMIPFTDKSKALKAVKAGQIWGFINIPTNFTQHMQERMLSRQFSNAETIEGSTIGIHLDMSSFLGSVLVLQRLYYAYDTFLHELTLSCGLPLEELQPPLKYETPVYGSLTSTYANQIVPGLLLFILFVLPLCASSVFFIQDRNAGSLDRMRVSGMTSLDMIVAHFVSYGSVQFVKIFLSTMVLVFGFSLNIKGPILLYIIVMLCNSACGLALGSVVGAVCENELQAMIAVFFVAAFLIPFGGVLWPVEGLSFYWKIFAYCLPTTLVSQSFRSVVFRGVSYAHALVWPGLLAPVIWICLSLTISLTILRRY